MEPQSWDGRDGECRNLNISTCSIINPTSTFSIIELNSTFYYFRIEECWGPAARPSGWDNEWA